MGLSILPVAFVIGVAWLAAAILVCVLVGLLVRLLPFGKFLQFPAYALVLILAWYLPNANALRDQERMDAVAMRCGWTVNRTADGVDGVFVESPSGEARWSHLVRMYPSVEHQIGPNEFLRTYSSQVTLPSKVVKEGTSTSITYSTIHFPPKPDQRSPARTLRFGVRYDHSIVASRIRRDEKTILDFDSNEVLAKHIEYSFERPGPGSLFEYAIALLTYQPQGCGAEDGIDSELSYWRILAPAKSP